MVLCVFAKHVVLSLRVPLSLCCAGLSLSIHAVGIIVLGLYVLKCITLHQFDNVLALPGEPHRVARKGYGMESSFWMITKSTSSSDQLCPPVSCFN